MLIQKKARILGSGNRRPRIASNGGAPSKPCSASQTLPLESVKGVDWPALIRSVFAADAGAAALAPAAFCSDAGERGWSWNSTGAN